MLDLIVDRYVVDEYLKGIDNRNTKKTYASSLRHFLDFINKAHIIHIDQENINQVIHDYKSYLLGRYTKPKTINQHLMTAKTFFSDYTNLRIRKLKLLKVEQKEPHYLTQSQLHLVLENIDDDFLSGIFSPFRKGMKGEFGLGLSIVKKTLNLMGYDIIVKNEKKGVSFTMQRGTH